MRSTLAVAHGLLLSVALAGGATAEERVVMSYPLILPEPTHRIVAVDKEKREARIERAEGAMFLIPAEGHAVLVVPSKPGGPLDSLVRVNVEEILEGNVAVATFGPNALPVVKKGPAVLGRPFAGLFGERSTDTVTTKAIRSLPDLLVAKAPPTDHGLGTFNPSAKARAAARRVASMNHLKQLALAFHNFHDAYGCFPPAAVIGPDGKPWHSWRVLLLPYLGGVEEEALFKQYDFSQPWDSPKNLAVAEKMPQVFRDPAREGPPDNFTDYAAITGEAAIFQPKVVTMKSADDYPACLSTAKKIGLTSVTDGTSNTMLFATLDPARKIPWTKPEDIVLDDAFPGIGKPAGIGAIHPAEGGHQAALVAFADGSVQTLPDTVDPETLRKLLTRAGGELVDRSDLDGPGAGPADPDRPPLVKVIAEDSGKLRLEID
jgi:hypothetical protein